MDYYSQEQKNIILSNVKTPYFLVLASPGSGKTTTMIGRYQQRKKKSIFLTFTKNTQADIAAKIDDNTIVYTIDSYCFYLCNYFNLLNKNYLQMYNPGDYKVIVYLNKDKISASFFDDIEDLYIDEIQDICFYQYNLIKFIQSCNPNIQIYMTGDTKQNIFVFRNTTNLYLYNYREYFPNSILHTLETNYRIKNKELLHYLLKVEQIMINPFQLYTKIPNNVPQLPETSQKYIQCVKHKTKYADTIYTIYKCHVKPIEKDICVLCRNNSLLNQVETDFILTYGNKDNIRFSNIHCAKGMEYTIVIFIGVEKDIIPSIFSDNIAEETNLFFTAISRPKEYLYMLYHDTPSIFLQNRYDFLKSELIENYTTLEEKYNVKNDQYISYNQEIQKFQKYYMKNPQALRISLFSVDTYIEKSFWNEYNELHYAKYLKLIYNNFPEHFTDLFKIITIPKKMHIKYRYLLQKTRKNYPSELSDTDFVILSSFYMYKKTKKIKPFLEILHLLHLNNIEIPYSQFDFKNLHLPKDLLLSDTQFADFENKNNSYKCLWDMNQTNIQHIAYSAKKNISNSFHIIDLINLKLFSIY